MKFSDACSRTWNDLTLKEQAQIVNNTSDKVDDFESSSFYSKSELREAMVGKSFTSASKRLQQRHRSIFCRAIVEFFQ